MKVNKSKPIHSARSTMAGKPNRAERSKTQNWFQDLLEAAPDAIVVVDPGGKIVLVNVQTERLFGYSRKEMLGCPVEMLITPPARRQHRGHRTSFFGEPRTRAMGARFDPLGVRKGGSEFPIEVNISLIKAADRILVISAIRDVTERKLLDEARFRLAAIVESSDDAIVSKTPEGIITSWNPGAQRVFGYTEKEAVGKPITILIPPQFSDEENRILARLRTGERIDHYETIRITKAGKEVDVSLNISPINDSAGRIIGFSKVARDISQRKRAEEALAGMTRKLMESQEQERTRIARELHDDINQRLALLAIDLAQLREKPSDVENRAEELQNRVDEISHDVEGLAHDLHSSNLDYLGVVAGIRGWCGEFAERQKMEIDFSSSVGTVLPHDVGLTLLRVLQEALHNAAKYSGVKRIEVQLQEESGEVHLIIRDLGKGFDIRTARQGRGLGLTSMQERVRLVNGRIRIESKLMGGTTIDVRVPLSVEAGVFSLSGVGTSD